jgi:hypothetical protein
MSKTTRHAEQQAHLTVLVRVPIFGRLVEGLISWIVGEDDRTRADFIVYLCNLLEGDKECQYEVTKKAVSMLHLFVELIGEPLIEYPSVLECVFSALFASLESNSPR